MPESARVRISARAPSWRVPLVGVLVMNSLLVLVMMCSVCSSPEWARRPGHGHAAFRVGSDGQTYGPVGPIVYEVMQGVGGSLKGIADVKAWADRSLGQKRAEHGPCFCVGVRSGLGQGEAAQDGSFPDEIGDGDLASGSGRVADADRSAVGCQAR